MELIMDVEEKNSSKEILKNSQFLNIFEKDGVYCLFHSLTLETIYGGQLLKILHNIFSQPRNILDVEYQLSTEYPQEILTRLIIDLKERGLIVPDHEHDLKTYIRLFKQGLNINPITHLHMVLTNECNLKCKYCFIKENRDLNPEKINEDIARKGIEVFAKLTEDADKTDKLSITFYGGEPLINADVLYSSMRYVRELERMELFKRPVRMVLQTNGVLVDNNTIDALVETKTSVTVSIDGPRDLHNASRIDSTGKGTFDKVIAGYRILKEAGINTGISCTLNKFNIEHIKEIIEFFSNELQFSGVGFNFLLPTIGSGNPLDISYDCATRQLIDAFKILREIGVYEDRMMRHISPYIKREFRFKDCLAVAGQIVLAPDGRIGPCQGFLGYNEFFPLHIEDLHSRLPSLKSGDVLKDSLFDEWHHRFPLNMGDCAKCFAIAICGGGCPYASFVNHGSIWKVDNRTCPRVKQILEWMLWDIYDRMDKIDLVPIGRART